MRLLARPLIALVHAYQWLMQGRPSPCRYVPSCSNYALEALEVHGALRGTALTVRRLARCHPWGGHGWDPVPPSRHGTDVMTSVPAPMPSPHTDKACR